MLSEDLPLKQGMKSHNFTFFFSFFFFAFISNELLYSEAYSAGSIPSICEEGIDLSIHREEQSFKLQLLRQCDHPFT